MQAIVPLLIIVAFFLIIQKRRRVYSLLKMSRQLSDLLNQTFRQPDNYTLRECVSLMERVPYLHNSPGTWNRMRNLYRLVMENNEIDAELKTKLHQELVRLGVNLPYMTSRPVSDMRGGEAGERETAHQLQFLGSDYKVLNGLHVRAGDQAQEFDHIVIGRNGVFHVDSKNYQGEIKFTANDFQHNGVSRTDPTTQMHRHEYILKELLTQANVQADVVGIICFTNEKSQLIGESPDFITLKVGRLLSAIKGYKPQTELSVETLERVESIVQSHSTPSQSYEKQPVTS